MASREPGDRGRRRTGRAPAGGRTGHGNVSGAERTARLAAGYVTEMTGRDAEGIVSLERTDDGGWLVDVEVVETHRVPDSTDILAVYEAELDPEGELVAYRRVKRYSRCRTGEN